MEKTLCELFAGVGGFRLALERVTKEWNTVWFSQWEPGKSKQWAYDCYVQHFGLPKQLADKCGIDIALVNKKEIPNHNLLVGGFPCQDYSVARPLPGAIGIQGKKGVLWWQIRDTLEVKKTPFVLLENVDRLLKSPANQRGRDFGVILSCFAALDYIVEWRVINAAEYGAGQRRRRIYIFAYKKSTKYAKKMDSKSVRDIFADDGFFASKFPAMVATKINLTTLDFKQIPNVSEHFKFEFENSGFMKDGVVYTVKTYPELEKPITLKQMMEKKNVDEKYFLGNNLEKWQYFKGGKHIPRVDKNGHEYMYSEGPIAFPDPINLPARTMLTSESSLNRSTHVVTDIQTGRLRLLTPLETERIQGFDDNWTNTGMPEKFRYFCMGNALVVHMVKRMGERLTEIFEEE